MRHDRLVQGRDRHGVRGDALSIVATGADWPLVDSAWTAAGVAYVLGGGACAGGSADSFESDSARKRWYHRIGGALSIVATGALVWALIAGTTAPVVVLGAVVAVKWLIATVRHVVTPAPERASV